MSFMRRPLDPSTKRATIALVLADALPDHERSEEGSRDVTDQSQPSLEWRTPTRRERFFAGYLWLILRNFIGWGLIVGALVAGPLVPGPGGIPLFLIGFALITFPGKRRLTARVLRGKPLALRSVRLTLITIAIALALAVPALVLAPRWSEWMAQWYPRRMAPTLGLYAGLAIVAWLAVHLSLRLINLLAHVMPRIRRRMRPWLRRHRIRLLPPRWRRRLPHDRARGPLRLREEILSFARKRAR